MNDNSDGTLFKDRRFTKKKKTSAPFPFNMIQLSLTCNVVETFGIDAPSDMMASAFSMRTSHVPAIDEYYLFDTENTKISFNR